MIKTVVDVRGLKRFKKSPAHDMFTNVSDIPINTDTKNMPNAKEIFRKMSITTNYAKNFGDRPRAKQDFNILRDKPLIKLPIAQVLKPAIAQMLSRWLTMND